MTDPIRPDAQGDTLDTPQDWIDGLKRRLAEPGAPTATDYLAKVLTVLDDLEARAAIEEPVSGSEFDFNCGVAYAAGRLREVLPPADDQAEVAR